MVLMNNANKAKKTLKKHFQEHIKGMGYLGGGTTTYLKTNGKKFIVYAQHGIGFENVGLCERFDNLEAAVKCFEQEIALQKAAA